MSRIRLIAHVEIKTGNAVKGIRMEGLRLVGSPAELVERYYKQGADELILTDIVASLYGRNHLTDLLREACAHVFVPVAVGGGVRCVADFERLLSCGADKVTLNTQALATPELVTQAAEVFGSQCVIGAIQAKWKDGRYEPFTENGRQRTHRDAIEWARELQERGAGEILLVSVDRDGTGRGLDLELIRAVASAVSIPVIAAGGASSAEDAARAAREGAGAVAFARLLHCEGAPIAELKAKLAALGVSTRQVEAELAP